MIKLIATDMDGTLLDSNKNLPPDFFQLLDRLERNDIKFVVASGRSYTALEPIFKEYCKKSTLICDNGAFIVKNGNVEFVSSIAPEKIRQVIRTCAEKLPGVYPVMCGTKGIYVSKRSSFRSQKELGFYYGSRILCDNLEDVTDTIFKIAIYDENDPQKYSFPVLSKIFGGEMALLVSGHLWMDVMNSGINKGAALAKIQNSLGISRDNTMAFGDFYNDIDLLMQAKYSYVMANANDDMKQYGKFTALSNDEYGVSIAITEYLDKNRIF